MWKLYFRSFSIFTDFDEQWKKLSVSSKKCQKMNLEEEFRTISLKIKMMLTFFPKILQADFMKISMNFVFAKTTEESTMLVCKNFQNVLRLLIFNDEGRKFLPQFFDKIISHIEITPWLNINYTQNSPTNQKETSSSFLNLEILQQFENMFEYDINISGSIWTILIDRISLYVKNNFSNIYENFFDKRVIGRLVNGLNTNKINFETAIYIAIFRNLFTQGYFVEYLTNKDKEETNYLLSKLEGNDQLLPFMIFFIQKFEKNAGNIEQLKGQGLTSMDEFFKKYFINENNGKELLNEAIDLENFKILPKHYKTYSHIKDQLFYELSINSEQKNLSDFFRNCFKNCSENSHRNYNYLL